MPHLSSPACEPRTSARALLIGGLALLALAAVAPAAGAQRIALGARAGTLGAGGEVTVGLLNRLNARVGGNFLTYTDEARPIDLDVKVNATTDARLRSASAIVDLLPFGKLLRVSAGAVYNQNEASILIVPAEDYTIDGRTFTPARLGSLTTNIGWESSIAPYVGFGLGNPVGATKRLGLLLDVGAMYSGAPRVTMTGTEMIAPTANQGPVIQESAKDLKWYPVVSLGLTYKIR